MSSGAYRLEGPLVLNGEGTGLEGDDRRSGLRVVVDGGTALATEHAVDWLAR